MPKVPKYNHKPLKIIYSPGNNKEPASLKQKSLITTLFERRKVTPPSMKGITKGEAATIISNILDNRTEEQ